MKIKIYLEVIKGLRQNGIDLDADMIEYISNNFDEECIPLLLNIHNKDRFYEIANVILDVYPVDDNQLAEAIKIIDSCPNPEVSSLISDLYLNSLFNCKAGANEVLAKLSNYEDASIAKMAIESIKCIKRCLYVKPEGLIYNGLTQNEERLTNLINLTAATFSKCKNPNRAYLMYDIIQQTSTSAAYYDNYSKLKNQIEATEFIAIAKSDNIASMLYESLKTERDGEHNSDIYRTIINSKSYNRAKTAVTMINDPMFSTAPSLHTFVKMAAYANSDNHAAALNNLVVENRVYLDSNNEDRYLTLFRIVNSIKDTDLLDKLATTFDISDNLMYSLPLVSEEKLTKDDSYPDKLISFMIDERPYVGFNALLRSDINAALDGLEELSTICPDADFDVSDDIMIKVKKPNEVITTPGK